MTDEDIWYFRHNGFHRLAQQLDGPTLRRLNDVTDAQIASMQEPVVWEDDLPKCPDHVRRLSKVLNRDPIYMQAAQTPAILDALEGILGPNIELITNKHNHLMVRPAGSNPVYWHAGEEPWDPVLVTVLIYLEESTLDNGCIRLVPGSHQRPFPWPRRPGKDFYGSALFGRSVPFPMPAGGVLLFNDCCFHGADTNHTRGSRRSMTLGYRAHDAHDVGKEDPEKILVRGERVYTGHPR
ncbi:MAG: phytanoyl-CoA dioxygenase family protein [Candidatus Latescibacterota bacterium]|nr:phytanoyl-CoA dioxygenase family protein [Candidatus Latescibacterota bacterium]